MIDPIRRVRAVVGRGRWSTYLYIIALVVVTTLSEQAVVNDVVYVQLVEKWVSILERLSASCTTCKVSRDPTLDTEAVNTTTSYSSPTLFIKASTPGRLMTYTL